MPHDNEEDQFKQWIIRETIAIILAVAAGAGSAYFTMREDITTLKAQLQVEKELRTHGLQTMAADSISLRQEVRANIDLLRTDIREDLKELKAALGEHTRGHRSSGNGR